MKGVDNTEKVSMIIRKQQGKLLVEYLPWRLKLLKMFNLEEYIGIIRNRIWIYILEGMGKTKEKNDE